MSYADGKMLAEVADGVGLITFNQPEKRNAMSVEMWAGLVEILEKFSTDDAVRVVVLTGAGDKAFVSGADISQFAKQRSDADAQREYDKVTSGGREKLAAFAKPVIARIRGFCLGGGLGIAMQADLRIAAEDSQFGIPAAKLGIGYGFDMVSKLVSLVGPAHAKTLLFTGERIDGAEAARIGLVNRVVPNDQLEEVVLKMARGMATNAPLSLRAAKIAVGETLKVESERNVGLVNDAVLACFDSADYREGRTAFMEKRKPVFKGV
jgi:enoyl-CoA hydratase/carnithine racemase